MPLAFLHTAVLFGLAGLAIPLIIHLWRRRQAQVVDWGAMQFLELQPAQRRRLLLEEWLLLAIRMILVALLVGGLAGPVLHGPLAAALARPPRDVVFILDASASMARTDLDPTPWRRALAMIEEECRDLGASDRWALVIANRPARVVRPLQSIHVATMLDELASPAGAADGPEAIRRALHLLKESTAAAEIVILTDGQRFGWVDPGTFARWQELKQRPPVRLRIVGNLQTPEPENYRVGPVATSRTIPGVGQKVRFNAQVLTTGDLPAPTRIWATIDDVPVKDWKTGWDRVRGQAVAFEHVFRKAGPHVVSVAIAPAERDGRLLDALPGDNRQDLVVEVMPDLPVLIVDGAVTLTPESPAYFLMRALSDSSGSGRASLVAPKRVNRLTPGDLAAGPRVVILADVPSLSPEENKQVVRYLDEGGAVLVLLGPRVDRDAYNRRLHDDGRGWLPCRLDAPVTLEKPIYLDKNQLQHPSLSLFQQEGKHPLTALPFRRWWRTHTPTDSAIQVGASFPNGDPWLIEKRMGRGRVLVSTVPFDNTWETPLARAWEFPVLVHELLFGLADVAARLNPPAGMSVRLTPDLFNPPWRDPALPIPASLASSEDARPGSGRHRVQPHVVAAWPGVLDPPGPAGLYRLQLADRLPLPIAVHDDPAESNLTPLSAVDRKKLDELLGCADTNSPPTVNQVEVWRWLLLGLVFFLCLETWLAHRMTSPVPS